MRVPIDLVTVAAALLDPQQKALRNKVGDDLLRGSLADAHPPRDLADPDRGVASDVFEPARRRRSRARTPVRARGGDNRR